VIFEPFTNSFTDKEVVLVDKNVRQLYDIQHTKLIEIEALEENKCMDTVLMVAEKLLEFGFDKGNTLVVIGGGITQDIGAYTAKTFKRGIQWKFIPTTLLSQCDSCIGGKTALNFKHYKNQLALFSAPQQVIIDTRFLETLKQRDIDSGMGEIVKLFITGGDYYVQQFDGFTVSECIFHALMIKKQIIQYDEFEVFERKALNYGHSFGHVIESLTNYEIPHGEAVMLGIEIVNRMGSFDEDITYLVNKFTNFGKIRHLKAEDIVAGLRTDKKVTNGVISIVYVEQPGETRFVDIPLDDKLTQIVHDLLTD
jgi:3-dehydroquinate synthase